MDFLKKRVRIGDDVFSPDAAPSAGPTTDGMQLSRNETAQRSGRKLTALEAHPREAGSVFARRHARVALEEMAKKSDVFVADSRADRLNRLVASLEHFLGG